MRVAAVIFDMDGVIIDTERPAQACCQAAHAAFRVLESLHQARELLSDWLPAE